MAVRRRQASGTDFVQMSARLPIEQSKLIEEFAWKHRLTGAAAITKLLTKALRAEQGEEYEREAEPEAE